MIIHLFMKIYQNILIHKMNNSNKPLNTLPINKTIKMIHKYVKEDHYVINNKQTL